MPEEHAATLSFHELAAEAMPGTKNSTHFQNLIADLAKIDRPDMGLSGTLTGHAFAPVAGATEAPMMVLTNHRINTADALKTLVHLGPRALPYLLAALDDKTPTKLSFTRQGIISFMHFAAEMRGNPLNNKEQEVIPPPPDVFDIEEYIKETDRNSIVYRR